MYSQNDEEKVILEYFGDQVGRFCDIGAWEGKTFSNTRALMEKGWGGVCVEPSPTAFIGLMANTRDFGDKIELVNVAVAETSGLAKFYDASGDAIGTLSEDHRKLWECKADKMRSIWIKTVAMSEIFAQFGSFAFINLDVEGTNLAMFKHLPFTDPGLRLICVEHDRRDNELLDIAEPHGFKSVHRTKENLLLGR